MERVLVSACLLGEPVRFDGTAATSEDPVCRRWSEEGRIVPFCPEVAAGLATPRAPVELVGGDGEAVLEGRARALSSDGEDLTEAFLAGARMAFDICRGFNIRLAVLKGRSPSCGRGLIHDGSFSGRTVEGEGIAAAFLRSRGIEVFSDQEWEAAGRRLQELEGS